MADKKFVGRSKPGKYENQVDIGLQQKDIDLLQENMKNGWVNIRVNKGIERKSENFKPFRLTPTK